MPPPELENLVAIGTLKRAPPSPAEVGALLDDLIAAATLVERKVAELVG